ncbi:MAG: universal stress protein [Gemmatimonadaceae bacterium]|nr:universal stress protein [Gemmatimonadaceae bacterium]
MRAFLVPLDGSALAESALHTAIALARRSPGARLEALVVLAPPPAVVQVSGAPVTDRRFDHDLYAEMERYAAAMRQQLLTLAPELAPSLTLLYGDAAERIAHFAREGEFDLIVMTTHGRTGVSRAWLGSVADGVLRLSSVPVLLLREETAGATRPALSPGATVVVPLDEGNVSEEILSDVLGLAGTDALIHLVHVVVPARWLPPPSALEVVAAGETAAVVDQGELTQEQRHAAMQRLDRVAGQLRARGVEATVEVVVHARAAEAILACAERARASLIAMTTHARKGAGRLLLGSVADKVVRAAPVPVLVRMPTHR